MRTLAEMMLLGLIGPFAVTALCLAFDRRGYKRGYGKGYGLGYKHSDQWWTGMESSVVKQIEEIERARR